MEEDDNSYEWTVTEERFGRAEEHIDMFNMSVETGKSHKHNRPTSQQALEHAMKALISAMGREYKRTHNLDDLVEQIHDADPAFGFSLGIPGEIYGQYVLSNEYRPADNPLTNFPATQT